MVLWVRVNGICTISKTKLFFLPISLRLRHWVAHTDPRRAWIASLRSVDSSHLCRCFTFGNHRDRQLKTRIWTGSRLVPVRGCRWRHVHRQECLCRGEIARNAVLEETQDIIYLFWGISFKNLALKLYLKYWKVTLKQLLIKKTKMKNNKPLLCAFCTW